MERIFVGRERELGRLESCFGKPSAFLIYGRRRIGKTAMLQRFCEGRRSLFLTCLNGSARDNLDYFSDSISLLEGRDRTELRGWTDFIRSLTDICRTAPTVVVIDEYPFLSRVDPSVSSHVQRFIDHDLKDTGSMLILCGSSVKAMREEGEDSRSPLFGRFDSIIHLGELSFEETRGLHPDMSGYDCLRLYLTFGGVPRYHIGIDQPDYESAIYEGFILNDWMMDETSALIQSEFPRGGDKLSILDAIASGRTSLKEISEHSGIDKNTVLDALRDLMEYGAVGVVEPMAGAPKRPRYFLKDALFAFHHGVLVRRRALIDCRDRESTMTGLKPHIATHLGQRFELFSMDLIRRSYAVESIGRWWIDDSRRDIHMDIDIVARIVSQGNRVDLFAECKFIGRSVGFHEYNILEERVRLVGVDSNSRLMIVSISGFDEEFREFADSAHVALVGPEEILEGKPMPAIWKL